MRDFKQYDIIQLSKDINPTITKGLTGVILEILDDNSFEVEFVKDDGTNFEYNGLFTFTIDKTFFEH